MWASHSAGGWLAGCPPSSGRGRSWNTPSSAPPGTESKNKAGFSFPAAANAHIGLAFVARVWHCALHTVASRYRHVSQHEIKSWMSEPCKSIKEGERAGVGKLISNYVTVLRQVVGSWPLKWSKRHEKACERPKCPPVHTDEVTAAGIHMKKKKLPLLLLLFI